MTASSLGIPLVEFGDGDESKTRYASETGKLLREGYNKVSFFSMAFHPAHTHSFLGANISIQYLTNGQPFCIRNHADPSRPFVFLPVRYMEEVRNAPQDKLSLPLYTEKVGLFFRI